VCEHAARRRERCGAKLEVADLIDPSNLMEAAYVLIGRWATDAGGTRKLHLSVVPQYQSPPLTPEELKAMGR